MISQGFLGAPHFNPEAFNTFINAHGATCQVFPVMLCPCRTATLEPDPLCPACKGTTRWYPSSFSCTLDLVNESSKRSDLDPGLWQEGTIHANVPTGIDLSTNDKVRIVAGKMTFTELCVKGLDDTLRFEAGVELLAVGDREHGLYEAGRDYTLTPPNVVQWLSGPAPSFGAQYSVRYKAYPEYLVVNDTPRLRIEGNVVQVAEVRLMLLDKAMAGL